MGERITRAELARRLGISRQRVHQLWKAGKITTGDDGLVDLEKARAEYEQNTDIVRRVSAAQVAEEVTATVANVASSMPVDGAVQSQFNFIAEKGRREHFNATIAEQKALERQGVLVEREKVEQQQFQIARMVRDRILGWPAKLANFVPPEAMKTIEAEADSLIRDMQDEIKRHFDG